MCILSAGNSWEIRLHDKVINSLTIDLTINHLTHTCPSKKDYDFSEVKSPFSFCEILRIKVWWYLFPWVLLVSAASLKE